MKKIVSIIIVSLFVFSPLTLAGHPKNFLKKLKENIEEQQDDGEQKKKEQNRMSQESFAETMTDFLGNKRQLLGNEVSNQYNVFLSIPEYKYWRWLVTISNGLVSKDLYPLIHFCSRNEAIDLLKNKPNGTGLLRAVYHDKGSIAVTYVLDEDIKHALLDVSSLNNYSLRNVIFCSKLAFLEKILVLGKNYNNEPTILSLPRALLSYPIDQNLVNEIN